jgi:adenosylhomocysteine nucleosidase
MKAVLFATAMEAVPFLSDMERHRRAEQLTEDISIFTAPPSTDPIMVAVIGMGKRAAQTETKRIVTHHSPSSLLNIGIAGALKETVSVGGIYRVTRAVDWRENERRTFSLNPHDFSAFPTATLVTSDVAVFDDKKRCVLAERGDIVDMEGAAIAEIAVEYAIPCAIIKGISDTAGNGDRAMLHRNLVGISTALAAAVVPRIDSWREKRE